MTYVRKNVRKRPWEGMTSPEDLLDVINREIIETLLEVRREVNRVGGDVRSALESGDVALTDRTLFVLADQGVVAMQLPPAESAQYQEFTFVKADSTANIVQIVAQPGELVVGSPFIPLIAQYNSVTVISDGTEWYVTAEVS